MNLFQRALQTNGKLFTNFELVFEFLAENIIFSNQYQGVIIDQSVMCYISMDSSRQALQTNGKLFFLNIKTEKYSNEYRGVNIVCRPAVWSYLPVQS